MSYWDTSALAKLYVSEPDSDVFLRHAAQPRVTLVTVRFALWEMRRVTLRKEADGALLPGAAENVWQAMDADAQSGRLRVIETSAAMAAAFDQIMQECYRRTPPLPIRTLDAIHLAAARVGGETEMVATDQRLRAAATLLGFTLSPG